MLVWLRESDSVKRHQRLQTHPASAIAWEESGMLLRNFNEVSILRKPYYVLPKVSYSKFLNSSPAVLRKV